MKVNGREIIGEGIAYDECHKIYVIEDEADRQEAQTSGYQILDLAKLPQVWAESCPLRFIYNWKLTTTYVGQEETAEFEE